jgi:uncharacterized protein (TIGR02117 family)
LAATFVKQIMQQPIRIKQLMLKTIYGLGIIVGAGLMLAILLSFVPMNSSFAQALQNDHIEIYVTSNGIHTDLILPVKTAYLDWRETIALHHFGGADSTFTHIGFGWGDRRFYMETPEWGDLTLKVAISAALWPTPSAMHVEYFRRPLTPNKHQRPIRVTPEQYIKLATYIQQSFRQHEGSFMLIPGKGYTSTDNFYEANEKFFLPKNCNNWVNQGLKTAGLKAAFFAPFPYAVMRHYR